MSLQISMFLLFIYCVEVVEIQSPLPKCWKRVLTDLCSEDDVPFYTDFEWILVSFDKAVIIMFLNKHF